MKKNMVRILAFVLVLILALGIIPLGALAKEPDPTEPVTVYKEYYDTRTPSVYDFGNPSNDDNKTGYHDMGEQKVYDAGSTIKFSDYNTPYVTGNKADGGQMYDFAGFAQIKIPTGLTDADFDAWAKANNVTYYRGDISIPKDFSSAEGTKFESTWNGYGIYAGYLTHQHKLSYWYSDNTTHWRECLTCKKFASQGFWEQFMFQNWHSDGDEDRVCDVCGHDIPYHEISVEEVKGGKITVELDEAPHRKKIVATAEPEEGYKLKKIHFIKVRDNGTEQEITRRKTSTKGTWWAYMPTYDLKVTAEFVKKK